MTIEQDTGSGYEPFWTGTILQDQIEEIEGSLPYEVKITATDGLKFLESVEFSGANTDNTIKPNSESLIDILNRCIKSIPQIGLYRSRISDKYSPEFAYSLRQLKGSITNVIRVRRSSDNTEQDFTADEITNGTLLTFVGSGDGFVTTWYNQGNQTSSNANLTNTTTSEQPKIVSSGTLITEGDKPCVEFTASSSHNLTTNLGVSFFASQFNILGR